MLRAGDLASANKKVPGIPETFQVLLLCQLFFRLRVLSHFFRVSGNLIKPVTDVNYKEEAYECCYFHGKNY
jgi:hypothetical protein